MAGSFAGLLTVIIGVILCFGGHRFFRFLMVLLGFAAGFLLGGLGIALVTKTAFPGGLWGWVVAIVVGLVLAGLSIPFYSAAVASLGGLVAYLVASGVMVYLGFGTGVLMQAVGIVAGALLIVLIYLLRVHRIVVILVTAVAGACTILAGTLLLLGRLFLDLKSATDPTAVMRGSPLWLLLLVVLSLAGVGAQWSIRSRASKPGPAPAPAPAVPATAAPPPAPPTVAHSERPAGPPPDT